MSKVRELLEQARPAITADEPDPKGRRGYRRGFSGLFGDLKASDPKFTQCMYASEAALFRLDHEWWPQHREAVVAVIEAAQALADSGELGHSFPLGVRRVIVKVDADLALQLGDALAAVDQRLAIPERAEDIPT